MRWFGPDDPVKLSDIRQAGCDGIVSALHYISNGEIWEVEDIKKRILQIESEGMHWSVVESLPVSEEIKTRSGNYLERIENYKQSIINLGACGVKIVTYNFMPILDWTRTNLGFVLANGAKALRFEKQALVIFDLFILERENAKLEYTSKEILSAQEQFDEMSSSEKEKLQATILAGLPGSEEGYSIAKFKQALATYEGIDATSLRENLIFFLNEILPTAEASGVKMVIHPDDPPYPILGLPRVVSKASDFEYLFEQAPSLNNGLCFCTGSLGGDVDMFAVVKEIVTIMQKLKVKIPFRPDHGHQMLDDLNKVTNPGYSGIGRLKGMAEIRGLEYGIIKQLEN